MTTNLQAEWVDADTVALSHPHRPHLPPVELSLAQFRALASAIEATRPLPPYLVGAPEICDECGEPFTEEEWNNHHTPADNELGAVHAECCEACKGELW